MDAAFTPRFFRVAGACALAVGAIVVAQYVLDWAVPPASTLEAELAAVGNAASIAAQLLPLAGIPLNLVALWAVTVRKWRSAPGPVSIGFLFLMLWAVLEIAFRGIGLFAATRWAIQARAAGPGPARDLLLQQIAAWKDVSHAVLLVIFCVAVVIGLSYGIATRRGRGLEKAVSVAFFLYALLALDFLVGFALQSEALLKLAEASYLVIRSTDRFLIGAWLWLGANSSEPC